MTTANYNACFPLPQMISKCKLSAGTHVVELRMARALAVFGTHEKIIGRERYFASFANQSNHYCSITSLKPKTKSTNPGVKLNAALLENAFGIFHFCELIECVPNKFFLKNAPQTQT